MFNMAHDAHAHREPLIRIARRHKTSVAGNILIRVAAIVLACIVTLVLIEAVGDFSFAETTKHMMNGAFQNSIKVHSFAKEACMLLMFAVALAPAFKMRFWNIGAQGQVLIGGLCSAIILYYYGNKLPNAAILPIMIVLSILGGALWAIIPAVFKVQYHTNETLFTLMMNYVAIQIVSAFIDLWKGQKSALGIIDRKAGYIPNLFGTKYGWIYVVTVVFAVAMFIYMTRTKHGYEISVVGESVNTARYAGINNKAVVLRTVAVSGAVCGITGFLYVSCLNHTISAGTGGSYGFTAIIVAWLANFNSFFMALISCLIAFLSSGSTELVNNNNNLNASIGNIIISIFLFFILGCEFFIRYRVVFNFGRHKVQEHPSD